MLMKQNLIPLWMLHHCLFFLLFYKFVSRLRKKRRELLSPRHRLGIQTHKILSMTADWKECLILREREKQVFCMQIKMKRVKLFPRLVNLSLESFSWIPGLSSFRVLYILLLFILVLYLFHCNVFQIPFCTDSFSTSYILGKIIVFSRKIILYLVFLVKEICVSYFVAAASLSRDFFGSLEGFYSSSKISQNLH